MISIDNNSASTRDTGRKARLLANLGMLATAIVWGMSFVSTRIISYDPVINPDGLHPVEIYLYRILLAYIVLLAFCHKHLLAYNWRDEGLFLLLGLSGGSIYFVTENIAVTQTDVANVSLLTSLSPLITAFILGALYQSERPGRWILMGSVVALIGVIMVVFDGADTASIHPLGDLLALAAAVSFSIYSILIKKINATYSTWVITRKTFFYGMITAAPFLLMEPTHAPVTVLLRPEVAYNLLFLGLICSLGAFMMMAKAIQVIGPVKASNYLYLQPVVTLLAGWILLNENIGLPGLVGCILIIGGLIAGEKLNNRDIKRSLRE